MKNLTSLFVTATDTNVGKTLVSSLLVSALHQQGFKGGYFKPLQTGDDLDTETVSKLTQLRAQAQPVYRFPFPAAPWVSAMEANAEVSMDRLIHAWGELGDQHWVVEGAGGLLVPLTPNQTIRDLVKAFDLPIVVVASTRLGTINHTLLTLEAIKNADTPLHGIVLTGETKTGLEKVLESFASAPVIAKVPHFDHVNSETIHKMATEVFPAKLLREIFYQKDEA